MSTAGWVEGDFGPSGEVSVGAGGVVVGAWEGAVVGVAVGAGTGGGAGRGLDITFFGESHDFITSVRNEAVVGVVGSRGVFLDGVEATLMDNMGELDGGGLASVRRIFFT
jgi:hypothetical protein